MPGYTCLGTHAWVHVALPLLQQRGRRLPLARVCVEGEAGGAGEVAAAEEAALLTVHVALVRQLRQQARGRGGGEEELD